MPKSAKKTTVQKTASTKKTTKTTAKKFTVSLDADTAGQLTSHLEEIGFSRDEFIKKAIREKISHDKISGMIDMMIR